MKNLKLTKVARANAKARGQEPSHNEIVAEAINSIPVPHAERAETKDTEDPAPVPHAEQVAEWPPEEHTYIQDCPIEKVIMIGQPRKKVDKDTCLELARSVSLFSEEGNPLYEQPITAWYWEERDALVVKHGHRRTTGAMADNWKTINVVVVPKQDEVERSFDQVIDNIHAEEMNPFDLGRQFKEWHDAGYSYAAIAEKLGKSKTRVASYVSLAKMPDYIIDFGLLYLSDDVDAYLELHKLHKLDERAAREFVDECIKAEHFTRKLIKWTLKRVQDKKQGKKSSPKSFHLDHVYSVKKPTVNSLSLKLKALSDDGHKDVEIGIKGRDGNVQPISAYSIKMVDDKPVVIFDFAELEEEVEA